MPTSVESDAKTSTSVWFIVASVLILGFLGPLSLDVGPIPITLQSLVVFSVALVLRPREFFLCISAYLLLGAAGVKVFAGYTAGVEKLLGPTAGFLWGFLFIGTLLSWIHQRYPLYFSHLLICAFGAHLLLLFVGFSILAIQSPGVDPQGLVMNLLPGMLIKTLCVALIVRGISLIQSRTIAG